MPFFKDGYFGSVVSWLFHRVLSFGCRVVVWLVLFAFAIEAILLRDKVVTTCNVFMILIEGGIPV